VRLPAALEWTSSRGCPTLFRIWSPRYGPRLKGPPRRGLSDIAPDGVAAVARRAQEPLTQNAKDLGLFDEAPKRWLKRAGIEDGHRPAVIATERVGLHEAKDRFVASSRRRGTPAGGASAASETAGKTVLSLVLGTVADGARVRLPLAVAFRVLGVPRQVHHRFFAKPASCQKQDDAHVIDVLRISSARVPHLSTGS